MIVTHFYGHSFQTKPLSRCFRYSSTSLPGKIMQSNKSNNTLRNAQIKWNELETSIFYIAKYLTSTLPNLEKKINEHDSIYKDLNPRSWRRRNPETVTKSSVCFTGKEREEKLSTLTMKWKLREMKNQLL